MKKGLMIFFIIVLLLSGCTIEPYGNGSTVVPATSFTVDEGSGAVVSGLTIHFIDVGQGDAALILCNDETMLIDGGNADDSDLIYSFLRDHGVTHLNYIVATHAHEDHVGGLAGALNYATVDVVLCPVIEYDSRAFNNFIRYLDKQEVSITVPKPGDIDTLGGAEVMVMGVNAAENVNDTSIILKITYGTTSFLFTGDAERAAEQAVLDAGYDLSATVLKVGHHGSDTSTTYPFLREIMPKYAVISCGIDNSYGHPHENPLSRLRDAGVSLYRTDMQGTITCVSDGETVKFTTARNLDAQTNPTLQAIEEDYYIGNANTFRFHRPSCSGLPAEHNQMILNTREEAINEMFEPCGRCNP